MGDICSIFRNSPLRGEDDKNTCTDKRNENNNIVKRDLMANERNEDQQGLSISDYRKEGFLNDEPLLRDLIKGKSNERNAIDIVCTVNRLLFFYLIVKWLNFEVWWAFGGTKFIMNRLI